MVEKRSVREDALLPEAGDTAADANREDVMLEQLPGGLKTLTTVHDDVVAELLDLAERQVAEARKKLGLQTAKPRLKKVEALFTTKAGKPPHVDEEVERQMRGNFAAQIAGYDGNFDHTLAVGYNNFDKTSVQASSNVQNAHDAWSMAVRIFKSEMRVAGAVLNAAIEAATHPATNGYDEPLRGRQQIDYYTRSSKIADSLLAYERTMQEANTALTAAVGQLVTALYGAVSALAVAEATQIAVTQGAYKSFWTSVQGAINQTGQLRS